MDKLLSTLQKIKKRPELYLSNKSLKLLSEFISGYEICQEDYQIETNNIFLGFDEYIHERYKIFTTHNAMQIISFFSISEEKAFDKFYELLEKFLEEHPENLKETNKTRE